MAKHMCSYRLSVIGYRLAVVLFAVLLQAAAAQQSKPTVRHHRVEEQVAESSPEVEQAESAMQRKDFAAAEGLLQKAVTAHPDDYRAWFDLGYVYNATQRAAQAVEAYRKSVVAKPDVFESNLNLGILLARKGENTEAAKYLNAATKLKPTENAEANLAEARRVLAMVQAEVAAPQAQSAGPTEGQAALELGLQYVKADKYPEAEQQLRVAVQKMPQDAEAHLALGSVLMHLKKYPEAQSELLAAVKLKPDLTGAYGNLAVVAAENKDYRLAIRALDTRAKYEPETPASYFLRATSFDNLKAVPQAVEYYQKFLAADAGAMPDQEWQARHRLIALDPKNAGKYEMKKPK